MEQKHIHPSATATANKSGNSRTLSESKASPSFCIDLHAITTESSGSILFICIFANNSINIAKCLTWSYWILSTGRPESDNFSERYNTWAYTSRAFCPVAPKWTAPKECQWPNRSWCKCDPKWSLVCCCRSRYWCTKCRRRKQSREKWTLTLASRVVVCTQSFWFHELATSRCTSRMLSQNWQKDS